MPVYMIAEYRVRAEGIDKVKRAIEEFVPHVRANEPGTRLYEAWQRKDDPTRFVHFFIFEDAAAHAPHGLGRREAFRSCLPSRACRW